MKIDIMKVDSFADPLTDCQQCKIRHRADNLVDVENGILQTFVNLS